MNVTIRRYVFSGSVAWDEGVGSEVNQSSRKTFDFPEWYRIYKTELRNNNFVLFTL